MNAHDATITTDTPETTGQRRLYRRAVSFFGLTLYRVTHAADGTVRSIAGRLLGFISWARRETTEGVRLVVRVGGVVVWVAVEMARVVPVVARVMPRKIGGMGA